MAPQHSLYLCGIGTSFHAALIGEYLLRLLAADHPLARAVHSFEFVCYPPPLHDKTAVLVVSHRGTKRYSLQALDRANRHGALTVAITGKDSGEGIHHAGMVLSTVEQELSAAHTKSYTTALALLAGLAVRLGKKCLVFVGGGPNAATAYEAALKVKETSYPPCEGTHVEQFLHGPVAGLSEEMAVWVVAPPGPSYARCLDVVKAAKAIGATTIALVQEGDGELSRVAAHVIELPAVLEALTPLLYVIPLQLFSYYLALARGTNPDTVHLDDPRHREADTYYTL